VEKKIVEEVSKPVIQKEKVEELMNEEMILRKKYSLHIQKKAKEISEVLGEVPEFYYGIVDTYCLSSVSEVIEIILRNPGITTKFSSYKI
jgi:hypothetical protein